ncbi:MAG: acyl carrier protein [Clostridia bacterium]|nr:acyl carrier protein [Clostridia bacterium]
MFEKVCAVLAEQLTIPADSIKPTDDITNDLNADSIDVVEMLMSLEDEYGVKLPEESFDTIKTVQDVVDELEKLAK